MIRPPDLVLVESAPGFYEARWSVPADVELGRFEVVGQMRVAGELYQATAPLRIRARAPITIPLTSELLPPPPHGQRTAIGPRNAPLADLPSWADELATILAYAIVFYGVVAGLHAVNIKGGFIVAAALLGVTWMLRSYLVEPIAGLIKQIILATFHVLVELVNFVAQWLDGIMHYFQGDVLKAITRLLMMAAFLWVLDFARTIPAIGDLFDTITETASRLTRQINELVDGAFRVVRQFRDDVEGRFGELLDHVGLAGTQLRGELIGHVDNLFGGLIRHVGRIRTQLLAQVDAVHTLAHARITLMGQTVALAPRLVRDRVEAAYTSSGLRAAHDTLSAYRALAARYSPPGAEHAAVWEVVDEFRAELAARTEGFVPYALELLTEARADIRAVQAGNPPARDPWPLQLQAPAVDDPVPLNVSGGDYSPHFYLPQPGEEDIRP